MHTEQEIKSWLKIALKNENLGDFSVSCLGNSEKGEGYMGDILFVKVSSKSGKNYDFVLKCSKKSQTLRDNLPIKECFENEIYFYDTILPTFTQFQSEKNVSEIFTSVPAYFGSFVTKNSEVVVLQNLKAVGYYLHDKTKPLPRDHRELVLKETGRFHAISAALQRQNFEKFANLILGMKNVWKKFAETTDPETFFGAPIEEVYEVLKAHLSETTAEKLKVFKKTLNFVVKELINDTKCFNVVIHGDCWSNNFMFKKESEGLKVAALDWQTAKFCNPATDISYLIYACASESDLRDFNDLLKIYYKSFSDFGELLKSDLKSVYSFEQLLADFKVYGKFGFMMTLLALKVAMSDKEEAPDFTETAENFGNTFSYKNKNQEELKDRTWYIVEHAAKQSII